MSSFKQILRLSVLLIVLTSCAASYKSINPEQLRYNLNPENQGITFSYQADVLKMAGNKKLAKKEDKYDVRVVAIKLTNNTGRDINFTEDLNLLVNRVPVQPLAPKSVTSKVKQSTASYLLYLLLTPMKLYVADEDGVSEYNIGYGLGPGITALNMGVSATANNSFGKELSNYDLYNQTIPNGETVYGLIGLSDYNFGTIDIQLKN